MKPYPSYKDSGVEWVGEIPNEWELNKLKYLSCLINDKQITDRGDIKISPENVEPYTGRCFNLHSDYDGPGVPFRSGDILLNKLRLYLVKILLPDYDGFSMGEMIVIRTGENVYNRYYYYLLFNQGLIDFLDSQSTGVKVPRVSPEIIMESVLPFPSLNTQKAIVSFLDLKTQQIDDLIEKTEKKIELLKEQRTALINHCVTKGLNPDVEMKDSGVEWIGEIPSHWNVSKFKYISNIVTGNTPSKANEELYYTDSEKGFLWVKPTSLNIGLGYVNDSEEYLTDYGRQYTRLIPKDSTMICCIGNSIGKHSISGQELSTNQQINSVIPFQSLLDPWYCLYYVNVFTRELIDRSNYVTLPIFTKSDLEDSPFILPTIEEQEEIVNKIKDQNEKIDSTIEKETQRIDLLKEYRQSLISEVVTGKIDVREWKNGSQELS